MTLIYSFLPLEAINGVKSPYKKKNYSPENETCVHDRCLPYFLPYFQSYFFWIKL